MGIPALFALGAPSTTTDFFTFSTIFHHFAVGFPHFESLQLLKYDESILISPVID